ncbi:hypothetical protein J6590_076900 [Homalodisca vitripennis]|nr:hypothetical protein J6590_076900 [Homalodisca vitripennis]
MTRLPSSSCAEIYVAADWSLIEWTYSPTIPITSPSTRNIRLSCPPDSNLESTTDWAVYV